MGLMRKMVLDVNVSGFSEEGDGMYVWMDEKGEEVMTYDGFTASSISLVMIVLYIGRFFPRCVV